MCGGLLASVCGSLRAAPAASSTPPPLTPFGIGSDAKNGKTLDAFTKWIPQMSSIGLTIIRTPGCSWGLGQEPSAGQFTWNDMDARMKYLDEQHFMYGGLLLGGPTWNTLDKPGSLPNNNLPAWTTYVSELVKHVHGRIKYWEVWNEPPNGVGPNKTPADYAKIVVASYDAAKAADPTCLVGLAAKSVHVNYLEQVIKAGAKGHFDYVVLHPYENLGVSIKFPGAEAVYMNIARTVHKMLAAQDPEKATAPLWFTELGFDAKRGPDLQADALVKAYTMGIAQGINCISWFEGMDGDSGPMGLLQEGGTPRPSYTALAQMIKVLGQTPSFQGWVLLNDRVYGFAFQGAKGTVMVMWALSGQSDSVDFGQPVSVIDPRTGTVNQVPTATLTNAPVLVDGVPAKLLAQAQGNLHKPFPWGGDYTSAKSVSITMGEKNVEKGLHTQSAESVAADVLAYGGSARSGDVPGGNVFMVDPNFLTYTATPIEITAMVRRGAANNPAQIELTYESATGEKKAPPAFVIPDNASWHKATWRISDAQFVSMYGYNFRFNKGNYVVQSVTVTKIDPQ